MYIDDLDLSRDTTELNGHTDTQNGVFGEAWKNIARDAVMGGHTAAFDQHNVGTCRICAAHGLQVRRIQLVPRIHPEGFQGRLELLFHGVQVGFECSESAMECCLRCDLVNWHCFVVHQCGMKEDALALRVALQKKGEFGGSPGGPTQLCGHIDVSESARIDVHMYTYTYIDDLAPPINCQKRVL